MPAAPKTYRKATPQTSYSWSTRLIHWALSRIGLVQTVFLFLWLAERAKKAQEPPFSPWIIYAHAAIGLIGSTGLSARFLARFSLYALTAVQLHVAYLYTFEPKLDYVLWLRLRVALRSIGVAAVYLRMLGSSNTDNGTSSGKTASSSVGPYSCGLTFLSIFTGLMGLLSLPASLVSVDSAAQKIETGASWLPGTLIQPEPWFGLGLSICFITASVLYTLPTVVSLNMLKCPGRNNGPSLQQRLFKRADVLTVIGLVALAVGRDSNVMYWIEKQQLEYWLQALLLLNSAIITAGLWVTQDLKLAISVPATANRPSNVKESQRVKTD